MDRMVMVSEYPERSYADIVALLGEDPSELLQEATDLAAAQIDQIVMHMHTPWAWFDHSQDVEIHTGPCRAGRLITEVPLTWSAQRRRLLPSVTGSLTIAPISGRLCELKYVGEYSAPYGVFKNSDDAAVGRRVLEAAVRRFVGELCALLEAKTEAPVAEDAKGPATGTGF